MHELERKGGSRLLLPVSASLLEACVLAILSREDTYGYRLTQALTKSLGYPSRPSIRCCGGCKRMGR